MPEQQHDIAEQPEENQNPKWQNTGPEYLSEEAWDGPTQVGAKDEKIYAQTSLLLRMGS